MGIPAILSLLSSSELASVLPKPVVGLLVDQEDGGRKFLALSRPLLSPDRESAMPTMLLPGWIANWNRKKIFVSHYKVELQESYTLFRIVVNKKVSIWSSLVYDSCLRRHLGIHIINFSSFILPCSMLQSSRVEKSGVEVRKYERCENISTLVQFDFIKLSPSSSLCISLITLF